MVWSGWGKKALYLSLSRSTLVVFVLIFYDFFSLSDQLKCRSCCVEPYLYNLFPGVCLQVKPMSPENGNKMLLKL